MRTGSVSTYRFSSTSLLYARADQRHNMRSERGQGVLERRKIRKFPQAYGSIGLHERMSCRDQTGDFRLRVVLQPVQRRCQLLWRGQEMAEMLLERDLLVRRHVQPRQQRACLAVTEDHFSFLGGDLVVGPRHKRECDEVMAERVDTRSSPSGGGRCGWVVACSLLVAKVGDQVFDKGCQGGWSHEGLGHDRNDYRASMTVP